MMHMCHHHGTLLQADDHVVEEYLVNHPLLQDVGHHTLLQEDHQALHVHPLLKYHQV